jgi:replicative DNA helicase
VLCSLLLSPQEGADLCLLQLRAEAFFIPAHQIIYDLILEFHEKGKPVEFVALKQAGNDRGLLDEIGGAEYLSDLYSFVPTAANAEYYIEIIRTKYILRRLIVTCDKLSVKCRDNVDELEPLLDGAEWEIFAVTGENVKTDVTPAKDWVLDAIDQMEKLYENRGAVTGLPTGFVELDRMTSGFHPAEMIVIAARPSMGKTALAMNIAEHVAVNAKKPVAVFSLEMSSQQLVQRLLCSRARVDLQKVRNGFLSNRDFPNLTAAASQLRES